MSITKNLFAVSEFYLKRDDIYFLRGGNLSFIRDVVITRAGAASDDKFALAKCNSILELPQLMTVRRTLLVGAL